MTHVRERNGSRTIHLVVFFSKSWAHLFDTQLFEICFQLHNGSGSRGVSSLLPQIIHCVWCDNWPAVSLILSLPERGSLTGLSSTSRSVNNFLLQRRTHGQFQVADTWNAVEAAAVGGKSSCTSLFPPLFSHSF